MQNRIFYTWRTNKTEDGKFSGTVVRATKLDEANAKGHFVEFEDVKTVTGCRSRAIAKRRAIAWKKHFAAKG